MKIMKFIFQALYKLLRLYRSHRVKVFVWRSKDLSTEKNKPPTIIFASKIIRIYKRKSTGKFDGSVLVQKSNFFTYKKFQRLIQCME